MKTGGMLLADLAILTVCLLNLPALAGRISSVSYIVSLAVIGCSSWVVAVFLLCKRPGDTVVRIAHWGLIGLSASVMVAWEGGSSREFIPAAASAAFFIAYTVGACSFVLFALRFPRDLSGLRRPHRLAVVLSPLCIAIVTAILHHLSVVRGDIHLVPLFQAWFVSFRVLNWLLLTAGIGILIFQFLRVRQPDEQKKVQWILWGCAFGILPFLLFTLLPEALLPGWTVPEEYTMVFFLLVPVSIAVAIFTHRAFDIEFVIRRTTTYTLVVTSIFFLYAVIVSAAVGVFSYEPHVTAAVAALLAMLMYEPLRGAIGRFVDRRFFRVRYDFRTAERSLLRTIKVAPDPSALANAVVAEIGALIPVERMGFFALESPGPRLRVLAHNGFTTLAERSIPFSLADLRTDLRMPIAISGVIEAGVPYEPADKKMFSRWSIALISPILGPDLTPTAFLALGARKSGSRFSSEDVDLLIHVSIEAGLALERLKVQRALLLQYEETRRLEELNQLKTDFVSYVSHEFRTPLTTIRMFTELLDVPDHVEEKRKEYAGVILGEVDRIDRMVHNVLTSARLEQSSLVLTFGPVDLVAVARDCLNRQAFRMEQEGVECTARFPEDPVIVEGNAEALDHAITNLVDNAIKYSPGVKRLGLAVSTDGATGICSVVDAGRGIPQDAMPHLWDKFYRCRKNGQRMQGAGLGLSLVRHIVDAHKGSVHVESQVGKGSTFAVHIPLYAET